MQNGPPRENEPIQIALANDYEIVVAGLAAMLAPFSGRVAVRDVFVGSVDPDPDEPIDVLLFDTFGRSELGFEALSALCEKPALRHVAVYSWETREPFIDRAIDAGVSGWLSKSLPAAELVEAIERLVAGDQVVMRNTVRAPRANGSWPGRSATLTERESEVLALLAKGLRNAEIAQAMFLSPETVKFHLRHLYRKLGVSSRGEAIAFAHSSEWYRMHHAEARRNGS